MAGGAIASLLPLLTAGFLFLYIFYRTRFIVATTEGQKLFFMSAATGFAIGLVAFPLYRALPETLTEQWYVAAYPAETGPLALALILSAALAGLFSLAYYFWFALIASEIARNQHLGSEQVRKQWSITDGYQSHCHGRL